MTLCLYTHAPGLPTIMTDTLVTIDGVPQPTPTTLIKSSRPDSYNDHSVLTAKFWHHGNCVMGFAGDVTGIFQFHEDLRHYFRPDLIQVRPMSWLSGQINDWNSSRPDGHIGILGFCPKDDYVNIAAPMEQVHWRKTRCFDDVCAIGSGGPQALAFITDFEDCHMRVMSEVERNNPYMLSHSLVGALNSGKLFNLLDKEDRSWGGYIHCRSFDMINKIWSWSPNWLHICVEFVDHGSFVAPKWRTRVAAFCDYYLESEVCVLNMDTPMQSARSWHISNLFHRRWTMTSAAFADATFVPQIVSFAMVDKTGGNCSVSYRTIFGDLLRKMKYKFNKMTGMGFYFSNDLILELARPVLDAKSHLKLQQGLEQQDQA